MKQAVLVVIKPDGINKGLVGDILTKFNKTGLSFVAIQTVIIDRKFAEKHYEHLRDKPFFNDTVNYFLGKFHKKKQLVVLVYYGDNAIKKCRKAAGATNPEEADPESIRGAFGRITTQGIYENVVHVSSNPEEAEREIKLWFEPRDILIDLYATKTKIMSNYKQKVWK